MIFNLESLPYLYYIEYTDGWTCKHSSIFIDPDGLQYLYEGIEGWRPLYEAEQINLEETQGVELETVSAVSIVGIKPEVLFHNLNICRIKKPLKLLSKIDKSLLPVDVIEDLMNSTIVYKNDDVVYDAPTTTYSLLVYDVATAFYKQVRLNSTGYRNMHNSSIHTEAILQRLQKYRVKR